MCYKLHDICCLLQKLKTLLLVFCWSVHTSGYIHLHFSLETSFASFGLFEGSDQHIVQKNNYEIAMAIDKVMKDEKDLLPNVDFYGGLLLDILGFETDLFTPIFVVGRTAGWSAHYFEQREQDTLIRPAARYTGK